MPSFTPNQPEVQIEDLDIYPDEYLNECSASDIEELIDELRSRGHLNEEDMLILTSELDHALINLLGQKHKLTKQEEETILNISKQH